MPTARFSQVSFSRGEITPAIHNRVDIGQREISLKTLLNGFINQEGCVSNRSGLEYIGEVKYNDKETRLIPFSFSNKETYVIEAGENYFRFIQNGGYICYPDDYSDISLRGQIVEIETPYLESELQNIKYAQSADVLTLCHINHPPKQLSRYSHFDWRLEDIVFKPSIEAPKNLTATWTGSTSKNTKFYKYCVTAVDSSTDDESTTSEIVSTKGHKEAYWTTSENMTLSWDSVVGASEYNIYKDVNGVMGYIGTTQDTTFVDDLIEPDTASTAPTVNNPFEDNNPSCCTYFQQRKIYANTLKKPQTLYASRTSNFNNFNYSRPLTSTDCVEIALMDKEINEIKHLIAFKDLIVLTSNNEYKVNGTDGIFQATPPPASIIQSCYGSSDVQPVISGDMVLFVQSGGTVLRDLGYDYLSDGYKGVELSIFANHIFSSREVKYLSYAKEPFRIVYVLFTDGTLAVLTYNKDQSIIGWARWQTEGKFISATTVREGQEDITYFVIQRGEKKYIERQAKRNSTNAIHGFYLDCALTKEFNNGVSSISGLNHLIGYELVALLDGGVVENLRVDENGNCQLPYKAKVVTIGLPYTFKMETLGIEGDNTHGLKKMISSISINVLNSREDFFVESDNGSLEQMKRSLDSLNNPALLYTGSKKSVPYNKPKVDATVKIVQKYPLPLTVTSISGIVNIEDVSDSQ